MKRIVQHLLNKLGYQITSYPEKDLSRRLRLINHYGINSIIDIGANKGQYSLEMRKFGYSGKLISFEPLSSVFKELQLKASHDDKWLTYNNAMGNFDGNAIINIAGNSYSSSLNNMLESHINAAPLSRTIGTENITVKKLDTIFNNIFEPDDAIMLKIDTQGYEKNVIEGANKSLEFIRLIQLEMSLVALYENELLLADMIKFLQHRNFVLVSLENGFSNADTGQLLQVDGIFVNSFYHI
jgi:FkbM family methyltransferase